MEAYIQIAKESLISAKKIIFWYSLICYSIINDFFQSIRDSLLSNFLYAQKYFEKYPELISLYITHIKDYLLKLLKSNYLYLSRSFLSDLNIIYVKLTNFLKSGFMIDVGSIMFILIFFTLVLFTYGRNYESTLIKYYTAEEKNADVISQTNEKLKVSKSDDSLSSSTDNTTDSSVNDQYQEEPINFLEKDNLQILGSPYVKDSEDKFGYYPSNSISSPMTPNITKLTPILRSTHSSNSLRSDTHVSFNLNKTFDNNQNNNYIDYNGDDMNSNESESEISVNDHYLSDNSIIRKSVTDPKVLIGWRVQVRDYGVGIILSINKTKFSSTKFIIHFENGKIAAVSLKRSEKKGKVPFTLISKIN